MLRSTHQQQKKNNKVITALDDKYHTQGSTISDDIVVNMAITFSARDLYDICKNANLKKQLPENEIPSFSWFKFQFWPKDSTSHTTINYMGNFPVKYMLQQRMIRKADDNNHYAIAIFKYAHEYAVSIRDICSFVCTDDKHKISMGEPNFPLAALPRGRQMLAANNKSFQVGHHDFSTISLLPTVILVNDIPEIIEKSWYRGRVCVGLKILVTDPFTPL